MVGAGGRHGRKAAHLPAWVQCDPGPRGCGVATTAEGQIYPSPVPAPSSSSPSATQRSGATPRQWTRLSGAVDTLSATVSFGRADYASWWETEASPAVPWSRSFLFPDFGCRLNLTLETNFETYQVLVGAAGRAAKGQHNQFVCHLQGTVWECHLQGAVWECGCVVPVNQVACFVHWAAPCL
ncbi:hypothetical protein U9M48_011300 [Paspalum notatum var. saurae]|uniref:Uncharacterized protein n=1 Tax=Paspalum notatum var. saurae TaxID=547442 RepID=A0AAQ3SWP8_PASNO